MVEQSEFLNVTATFSEASACGDREQAQLGAAQSKFDQLVNEIPMLATLADKQGTSSIQELNDLCPILFKHSALKSYPMEFIENGRYDRLTAWLNKLTRHNLTDVDTTACTSIDSWLALLERETPMRLANSSGTTGKISFFPRSVDDTTILLKGFLDCHEPKIPESESLFNKCGRDFHLVWAGYRGGNSISRWLLDEFAALTGDEGRSIAMNPRNLSADVLSLAGRLRAAEASGRVNDISISPEILERREQSLADEANHATIMETFLERLENKRVITLATWGTYLQLAATAKKMGMSRLFAEGSFITGGGGSKGFDLPADYQDQLKGFFGVDKLPQYYAMTETNGWMRSCGNGHYHIPESTIPFLLDLETGAPLPRRGQITGRYAFMDLLAVSYWGGCVSGDLVTIDWESECGCGQGSPFITGQVERLSERNGGDDKITCSGAPRAHDEALNFLAGIDN